MLPTKSHTWFTDHELISSIWAWHRLWLVAVVSVALAVTGVVAFRTLWLTGDASVLFGLGDSLFIRLFTGVLALKSNGDAALVRFWLLLLLLVLLLLLLLLLVFDEWSLAGIVDVSEFKKAVFCCIGINWRADTFGNWRRLCDDVVGDCCWRNAWWLLNEVCDCCCCWLFSRFCGPLSICWYSASFAARACVRRYLEYLIRFENGHLSEKLILQRTSTRFLEECR